MSMASASSLNQRRGRSFHPIVVAVVAILWRLLSMSHRSNGFSVPLTPWISRLPSTRSSNFQTTRDSLCTGIFESSSNNGNEGDGRPRRRQQQKQQRGRQRSKQNPEMDESMDGNASQDATTRDYEHDKDDDDFDSAFETTNEEFLDGMLQYSIDSFLRGDYDRPFAESAPAPLPGLTPRETIELALQSLRQLNDPEPYHGAAVLLRFCAPLNRGDRWGRGGGRSTVPSSTTETGGRNKKSASTSHLSSSSNSSSPWKEILRGALTPTMLANRIRASPEFSGLLDWVKLDVTDGASFPIVRGAMQPTLSSSLPSSPSLAFVNAALYFEDGTEPTIIQCSLRSIGGVWLIDSLQKSETQLFLMEQDMADHRESDMNEEYEEDDEDEDDHFEERYYDGKR